LNELSHKPIFLISIVSFHHKKGTIVEYAYPEFFYQSLYGKEKDREKMYEDLSFYALPDAIHNKNEDCVYFTLQ